MTFLHSYLSISLELIIHSAGSLFKHTKRCSKSVFRIQIFALYFFNHLPTTRVKAANWQLKATFCLRLVIFDFFFFPPCEIVLQGQMCNNRGQTGSLQNQLLGHVWIVNEFTTPVRSSRSPSEILFAASDRSRSPSQQLPLGNQDGTPCPEQHST